MNASAIAADPTLATLHALEAELGAAFFERRREIRGLIIALLAGEHVLLLGPPGTAKSNLAQVLSKALDGATYFESLVTKFTVPEELFGPISLKGLENDDYRRVTTGYLPSVEVAFLDEIFKASSSILNALLTLLNERRFDNGGQRVSCPLEIAVAASNELPQDDGLSALYDRFLLRYWVDYIADRDNLAALLMRQDEPRITARINRDELAIARSVVAEVQVPRDVVEIILTLRDRLAREHGIVVSDRRWRKVIRLVRAAAYLEGRDEATARDLVILADALWDKPDQRAPVRLLLAELCTPQLAELMKHGDAAAEIFARFEADTEAREGKAHKAADLSRYNTELAALLEQAKGLIKKEALEGNDEAQAVLEAILAKRRVIGRAVSKALGMS